MPIVTITILLLVCGFQVYLQAKTKKYAQFLLERNVEMRDQLRVLITTHEKIASEMAFARSLFEEQP